MDNNDFKLNETGINPVDTASENNDIYFTNVNSENYEKNNNSYKYFNYGGNHYSFRNKYVCKV